jgi:hypothetical protein
MMDSDYPLHPAETGGAHRQRADRQCAAGEVQ